MSEHETDDIRSALAPLPPQALRLDEAMVLDLEEVGITRIGELFDLSRDALPSRFGDELLLRLDQAMGEAFESITPIMPVEAPRVERFFAGPVKKLEAIQLATKQLLKEMSLRLHTRESAAAQFDLTLRRSDRAEPVTMTVRLSGPSRDAKHLWSLFADHAS